MKYYNTNNLSKWTLNFNQPVLEQQFHKQNRTKDFFFFNMMVMITCLWTIISLIIDSVTFNMIILLIILVLSPCIVRIPSLKFCQYYIFILQVLACIAIPSYNQSDSQPYWRIYLNGAASMLWVFVEYQSFLMECIAIVVSITAPIITLKMKQEYIVVCMLFMILLVVSRYMHNKNQRLLFLALLSFEQWQEAIEKTVPAYFIVSRFEFRTHQMYLHDQNRNFQKFMEVQYKSKKSGLKSAEDNKLYIEFLKHCEIEQSSQFIPQCFSPVSTNGIRSHGNTYSHKNLNSFFDSNQNILGVGNGSGKGQQNNNILSSNQLKAGVNTPASTANTVTSLFDFMLKKHDQLYAEMIKQKQIPNAKEGAPSSDRKNLIVTQLKTDDKKVKANFTTNTNFGDYYSGDYQQSRRNTMQGGNNSSNHFEENITLHNILQKEETIKVVYKNPSSVSIQKFKVKIVPLIMQEPLLAICIQDITQNEEDKKVKKIEQDNNTINVQVISKIKSHLEFLFQNISKIKSKRMKQSIVFPLNIIRSTAVIEKNRITYEPFTVNALLKDLAQTFTNVAQVKVKQNIETATNYMSRHSSKEQGNAAQTELDSQCEGENGNKIKEFELIDPESFEEYQYAEHIKKQKESIISKYNLAGIISANHEFLSFSTQNQLAKQHTFPLASLQNIQADYYAYPVRGVTQQVASEFNIPQQAILGFTPKNPTDRIVKEDKNNCSLDHIYPDGKKVNSNSTTKLTNKQRFQFIQQKTDPTTDKNNQQSQPLKYLKTGSSSNELTEVNNNETEVVQQYEMKYETQKYTSNQFGVSGGNQKGIKQKNIPPKQQDEQAGVSQQANGSHQQDIKNKQFANVLDEYKKRGFSIPSTAATVPSYLQQGSNLQNKFNHHDNEDQNEHNHHMSERGILPKKVVLQGKTQTGNNQNNKNLSAHNLFVQNTHTNNLNSHNNSLQNVREDRNSSIGQYSLNNMPSLSQLDQEILAHHFKKQNNNQASQLVTSHRVDQGFVANSLMTSAQVNNNHASTMRNLTVPFQFENNLQNLKTSTHLETEGMDVSTDKENKPNRGHPTKKNSQKMEIQMLSNYRLVFQALCGIITCFGYQNIQIVIETFNKKLYNSIRFSIKSADQQSPQTNTQTNKTKSNTGTAQEFNFENYPQGENNPHSQTIHQYQMFPNLITPNNNNNNNNTNNMSPASNYSHGFTFNQAAIETLNTPQRINSNKNLQTKTAKFDMNSTKKVLSTEDDFKKNLYGLNQHTNRHLANKIWRSINEIAELIGPQKLEFSENTISIELFTDLNIIKEPKLFSQDINLNTVNKPNRNSIFNANQFNSMNNNNVFNYQQNTQNQIPIQSNLINAKDNIGGSTNINTYNTNTNLNINNNITNNTSLVANNNLLQDPLSNNISIYQNNMSMTNNNQTHLRFEQQSATNKNSFNNLYQNTSFQNYLTNPINVSEPIVNLINQSSNNKLKLTSAKTHSSQQSVGQPFLVNSKLRIPEEEEQQPYVKKQSNNLTLSLMSLQSQQDEGVREVQPIKSFLNQNAKFQQI